MYAYRIRRSPRYVNPRGAGAKLPTSDGRVAADPRAGRCMALVDARFLAWLDNADDGPSQTAAALSTDAVAALRRFVREAAGWPEPSRVYWYTDQEANLLIDGVLVRTVGDADLDGGLSIVRAMSADIQRLAEHAAADHLLVASDDERLWAAIDEAQLRGLTVALLCDDSAADYAQLRQDDPSWARLLAQADRCLVWDGRQAAAASAGSRPNATGVQEAKPAVDRDLIMAHLARWWDEEPEDQRTALQHELQEARGLPQEVDRQLLLSLSRVLGHPLSWPEKKLMREGVRHLVLGEAHTTSPLPAEAAADTDAPAQTPVAPTSSYFQG